MTSKISRVAIIGGAGNLGSALIAALTKDPQFKLTIVTRQSSTATFPPGLDVIRVGDDYPQPDLEKAFAGQDAVVAATSFRANSAQITMIDAAVAAGVRRFIPADYGSNAESKAALDLDPRLLGKKQIIDHCRKAESDVFSWTSVVTGLWLDMALTNTFLGFDLKNHAAQIGGSGDGVFSCSIRATVVAALAAILRQPAASANRYLYVSALETSQNQLLAVLKKRLGVTFAVSRTSIADMVAEGKRGVASGDFMAASKLALVAAFSGEYGNDFRGGGLLANAEFGIPTEDVDEVVTEILTKAGYSVSG